MAALELVLFSQHVTSGDNSLAITLTPLQQVLYIAANNYFYEEFFKLALKFRSSTRHSF